MPSVLLHIWTKIERIFLSKGQRIAIIPFDNQTGDSLYAAVGDIGSSWISGRLDEVADVRIIPYLTVREYLPYVAVLHGDPEGRPIFGQVVDADYLITGAYFLKEQNLHIDARLVDARSRELIYPIAPVSGPKESVMQVLELLRLKIAGLLTNLEEVKLGKLNPPDYHAYLYYLKGLEFVKSGSYQEGGRMYLEKAIELQPDFVMPHLFLDLVLSRTKKGFPCSKDQELQQCNSI